jgi:hypothetical protein
MNSFSKKLFVATVIGFGLGLNLPAMAHPHHDDPGIQKRLDRQELRMEHGQYTGELTRREVRRLRREHREIIQLRRGLWADGRLTREERYIIHDALDQVSRHIRHLKHNRAARFDDDNRYDSHRHDYDDPTHWDRRHAFRP